MKQVKKITLITLLAASCFSMHSYANTQLNSVRTEIISQLKKIEQQKKEQQKLVSELKKQETAIANHYNELDKMQKELNKTKGQITSIEKEIQSLDREQIEHKKALAKQLERAFKIKRSNTLDLIFDSTETERNERIITYFSYLNQQRKESILKLRAINQAIYDKKHHLEQVIVSQEALLEKQRKEHALLLNNQAKRKGTLSQLQQTLQKDEGRLAQLKLEERNLKEKLRKAEEANKAAAALERKKAAEIEKREQQNNYVPTKEERALINRISGIGTAKRQYAWPVQGALIYRYGDKISSELYWKGIVIKASEGTPVKSISSGKVILASWLEGYGFIVAIDHGKGDMSLYGYNQRLNVKVGQIVSANQTIAYVGNTGGQSTSALYFEIRREGKPLNPTGWLK